MSLFGENLRTLIDVNKTNIYALAKASGIERTAIHKIISGDRIPSEEYVNKLADVLPLSPEERQQLLESYNISKIGELKYRQRIQVKELIESIAYIENGIKVNTSPADVANPMPLFDSNTTAIGHFAVNNLIKSVIEDTLSEGGKQGGKQELDFFIPESYGYFYNELLASYLRHPQMQIRHIMAFAKKTDFINHTNRNLSLLSHVLPFAFAPGTGYFPYYYYRTSHDVEMTQAMPYFILTSRGKLVLINRDFSKAAFICDADIVALHKESFDTMLEQANPLIEQLNSAVDFFVYYKEIVSVPDLPVYWIEPEPCISLVITDELIDEYLKQDIPDRDGILNLICKHCDYYRNNQFHIINICTTDGLYRIINTGYLYNIHSELMNPLSRETTKQLLNILKTKSEKEKENVNVIFTNPSKITVPGKTCLSISRKAGVNFIMNSKALTSGRAICILEDSIDEAFWDFAESLEESGITCSASDSLGMLSSIIDEL